MQGSSGVGEPVRASLVTAPRTGRQAAKTLVFLIRFLNKKSEFTV